MEQPRRPKARLRSINHSGARLSYIHMPSMDTDIVVETKNSDFATIMCVFSDVPWIGTLYRLQVDIVYI